MIDSSVSATSDIKTDVTKCLQIITIEEIENMESIPGENDLEEVCPRLLDIFICFDNMTIKHLGVSIKDLAELPSGDIPNAAKIFVNTQQMFTELCTSGTFLNNVYQENAQCLATIENPMEDCQEKAQDAYSAYREFIDNAVTETPSEKEAGCMVESYKAACISTRIKDACGADSHALFLEMVKRSSFLKYGFCSEKEIGDLKTKFLDYLELNESHRPLFAQAFDFRRRK